MAFTITPNMTTISEADSTTNWSSSNTISADTDNFRETPAAIGLVKVSQQLAYVRFDYYTANSNTYYDASTNPTHLYFWVNVANGGGLYEYDSGTPSTSGGVRLYIEDGAGNSVEWYVAGSDTYAGGWRCFTAYTDTTADTSTGTINKAQIRYFGVKINMQAKTTANANNVWVDYFRYGSGLTAYGTDTSQMTWEDIYDGDDTAAIGVIRKQGGIYFVQGAITVGDNSGSNSTDFYDNNQVLVFEDAKVSSSLYAINVVGNATGTTDFQMGSKAGTSGISGCVIRSAGTNKYTFTATDTDLDDVLLYGSTFYDAGAVSLPTYGGATPLREVLNCNFESCLQVNPSTCTIRNSNFIDTSSTGGALLWNSSGDIEDCNFIANTTGAGIEHNTWNGSEDGTVTTADATGVTLTDSAATFTGNVAVGDIVYNETDDSYATVVTVDSNTQITTDGLTGGTDNQFALSDAYSIATPFSYTDLVFSGNTYDVNNSIANDNVLAISKAGTSNPSTYPSGDNVVVQGSVSITITVKDTSGSVISGVQTAIYKTSDRTELMNEDTNASGVASTTYAGSTPVEVEVRCRKGSAGATKYIPYSSLQTIASGTGLTLSVTLREDTNNNATT